MRIHKIARRIPAGTVAFQCVLKCSPNYNFVMKTGLRRKLRPERRGFDHDVTSITEKLLTVPKAAQASIIIP